jgi:acylphosphatase
VGFRYTCQALSRSFAVGGYVRNRADGKVELVVEGDAKDVQAFLDTVAQDMAGYVEHQEIQDGPIQGFKNFSIRH